MAYSTKELAYMDKRLERWGVWRYNQDQIKGASSPQWLGRLGDEAAKAERMGTLSDPDKVYASMIPGTTTEEPENPEAEETHKAIILAPCETFKEQIDCIKIEYHPRWKQLPIDVRARKAGYKLGTYKAHLKTMLVYLLGYGASVGWRTEK